MAFATENPAGGDRPGRVVILERLRSRAADFLSVREFRNANRWADALLEPPPANRGRMANRVCGEPSSQLHSASDFDTKTQDMILKELSTEAPRKGVDAPPSTKKSSAAAKAKAEMESAWKNASAFFAAHLPPNVFIL